MPDQFDHIRALPGFSALFEELTTALGLYWRTAASVLEGGGITLAEQPEGYLLLENNFFSLLFLYSHYRLDIPPARRILYAAVSQCFRGMVTGCDNLLDDEYKRTLETSLPAKAWRFRSVMDIMVSEHVMFNLLVQAARGGAIREELLIPAVNAALRALTRSGAQEAGEEGGMETVLEPGKVLTAIHHYKTGVLFQAPWALPEVLESLDAQQVKLVMDGLYQIGMGCQILDDLVDIRRDTLQKRHNYVASLIYHAQGAQAWEELRALPCPAHAVDAAHALIQQFPAPIGMAVSRCRQYLHSGIAALFGTPAPELAQSITAILARRIGADVYLNHYP